MKKIIDIIRWIGVANFGIMALFAFANGGIIGGLLLILGGAIIAPLDFVSKIRGKLKLNKVLSIVIAVVLFFVGILVTPISETPTDDPIDSQISESLTDDDNKTNDTSTDEKEEENKSDEKTESEDETVSNSTVTTKPEQSQDENTVSVVGTGKAEAVKLSDIPAYSGNAFVVLNNNVPNFSASELKSTGYETYSDLDSLGRTRTAIASVGRDTMPKADEERGSISAIKPTGWQQAKYSGISGGYLYNRCHLIGWQLSAENANKSNLLTGTRYLNTEGMLPFENMVADYIKETGNHVAYRITPIYDGNNLLASGVQMEAYSVEDGGEGISFNVYCYNVQPNITINYATGASTGPSEQSTTQNTSTNQSTQQNNTNSNQSASQNSSNSNQVTQQTPTTTPTPVPTPEPKPTPEPEPEQTTQIVYIAPHSGSKYHKTDGCRHLKNALSVESISLSEAINQNYGPCGTCY